MTTGQRILVIAAFTVLALTMFWGVVFGTVVMTGGVMSVSVHEGPGGNNFSLSLPMGVIEAAVTTGTLFVDGHEIARFDADLSAELEEWGPVLREMLEVLDDCPDVTFVEVDDRGDRVRIFKEDGELKVEVDDSEVTVRVSIPARAASRTVGRLLS